MMGEVIEGYICPLCLLDLCNERSLLSHFNEKHSDQPQLARILRDVFKQAKKIVRKEESGQQNIVRRDVIHNWNIYDTFQEDGATRNHKSMFLKIRNERLEGFASETNKLIIRLDKLLIDVPSDPTERKRHEQTVVPWIDEGDVFRCPECAKSFHLTRRKHHCRLCGSIMCNDCSRFLPISQAEKILSRECAKTGPENRNEDSLRSCQYCLNLLECRERMKESRNSTPPITDLYNKLRDLYHEIHKDIEMYEKMCASLCEGKSKYQLSDASTLWEKIMKLSEKLGTLSVKIASLNLNKTVNPPTNKEMLLQKAISSSINGFIQTRILALPALPSEDEYVRLQEDRRRRVNEQILKQKQEDMTDALLSSKVRSEHSHGTVVAHKHHQPVNTEGWIPDTNCVQVPVDDPLIIQINNIKSYIKQARLAYKFDEVASLENHLKELQEEYYRQQS